MDQQALLARLYIKIPCVFVKNLQRFAVREMTWPCSAKQCNGLNLMGPKKMLLQNSEASILLPELTI